MDLATAIASMEGWNVAGSIANRNNNPGNLRYSPLQSGSEQTVNGKFATFASPEVGWQALQDYIDSKAAAGVTLRDFIYTYAPPNENNTSGYLNYLSGQLGIGADSPLNSLYGNSLDSASDFGNSVDNLLNTDSTTIGLVELAIVVGIIVLTR